MKRLLILLLWASCVYGQSVKLTWTSACANCTYNVIRNSTVIGASITPVAVPGGQWTWTDVGPASGQDTYTVRTVSADSNAVTVTIVPNTPPPPPPPPPVTGASFVKLDTTTKANYSGVYGAKGSVIALGASNLPAGATLSVIGNQTWTWASGFGGSCWYGNVPFHIIVNYTGQVALYIIDWDQQSRNETVTAIGATALTTVSNFTGGVWVVYNVVGGATFTITPNNYPNGVVSAVMFQ